MTRGEQPDEFYASEHWVENLVFNYRRPWLLLLTLVTLFLGYQAFQIEPQTGFRKMIPTQHPYMQSFEQHREDVPSGNNIRLVVENRNGTIFDADYLQTLQEINDEVFLLNGVDRANMKSLWTKNVQWRAITEEGFDGDVVMFDDYNGSPRSLEQVRANVLASGEAGRLVANDFNSSIIFVPLLDFDPKTLEPLNYSEFSDALQDIRKRYSSENIHIRIVGFAQLVGNLIDGITTVQIFFGIVVLITAVLLFLYCRSIRATIPPLFCALVAIVWQLGILRWMGYGLDPFSMLVPFLIFSIGVSHAVQNVNYMMLAAAHGADRFEAARQSFRNVWAPGLAALISDGVGFFTLFFIPVAIIQELAISASVGIVALVVSKLVLLPLLISLVGVSEKGIARARLRQDQDGRQAVFLCNFIRPHWARVTLVIAVMLGIFSLDARQDLKIGDLDAGAPELRPNSIYNQDVAFVTRHYSTSSDLLIVMVESEGGKCVDYETVETINRFQWQLQGVKGIQTVDSTANGAKRLAAMLNEGNIRWSSIARHQKALESSIEALPADVFFNMTCDLSSIYVYLDDHKAETLTRVTDRVKALAQKYNSDTLTFKLAAGNAGIEAATNEVIASKQTSMLILIYTAVSLVVFLTFRNLRSLLCIMPPLILTSLFVEVLMTYMGIGVKVATLPVIALGVGIGVDYGIYIYSRLQYHVDQGHGPLLSYLYTLKTAGRAVVFTGVTLASGVSLWIFSPIKFQADMGILLTFMFLWNMVGALTLLPAIASFTFFTREERRQARHQRHGPAASPAE